MTTATTMRIKGNDVVFRVHRDTAKVLSDGSPDPAWVREVTMPCLPTDGRTLAQHLITCQQEAETQAAAAPLKAVTLKTRSAAATETTAQRAWRIAQSLGQTEEERQRLAPLAKGLTVKFVGNSVVAVVEVDGASIGEWAWGGTPAEGVTFEQHFDSCERESLLLAEHELKQRRPQAPTQLNI